MTNIGERVDVEGGHGPKVHDIEITVDGEKFTVPKGSVLTANQVLQLAGLTIADHYLIEIQGKKQISYQDHGEDEIKLKDHDVFRSGFVGPTPVSDVGPGKSGVSLFADQLRQLGFEPKIEGNRVSFAYLVEAGKFEGKEFEHGVEVPQDFPLTPPSGPHVKANIHSHASGGAHPTGGVHASPFGSGWQYWSRPFTNWARSRKRAADYLAFVRLLWVTQ